MGIHKNPSNLAAALFSRVQLRVLGILFGQPNQSFQITEVIRLAGSGRGAVQRELEKLAAAGILTAKAVKRSKTYQANNDAPIFEELHSIIQKTVGLREPLRRALNRHKSKIVFAFVFGSIAKGRDTAKSDIDLMIVGHDLTYNEIYSSLQSAERSLLRPVNPSIMSVAEWKRKLVDGNSFLTKIVQQPKFFVLGSENDVQGIR
jgi:predicted nucleotidyltransferase